AWIVDAVARSPMRAVRLKADTTYECADTTYEYAVSGFSRTCSKQGLSIYIRRYRQTEILQYGGGQVDDPRRLFDGPVRNQRARGLLVVEGAVVARPLLHVRIDDARRRSAQRRLPRDPVTVGETDLKLRGIGQERTRVDVILLIDGVHDARAGRRIGE